MNTCPKCGSPQVEEQTNYAKETGRTWWVCGTFQTRDCHPRHSELCLEREEKNTLQRKVEELQVALDFANEAVDQRERSRKEAEDKLDDLQASTIHSCGDFCSRPMCILRRERDAYKEALEMIAYDGSFPKLDCQKLADATLTEIELSKEGETK